MESKKVAFFHKLSLLSLFVSVFGSILFFIPYIPVTLDASKGFFLSVGITLSLFFYLMASLGEGKISLPNDRLILFALLIPIVFLVASLFSASIPISLFGNGFEIGTFASMMILFLVLFLSSIYFQTEKRLWYFYASLFVASGIIALFQLFNLFVGFDKILPSSTVALQAANLIGSWNDLVLFFGLVVLLLTFSLDFLQLKKSTKIGAYVLWVVSLFFLVAINFNLIWFVVGILSVIIFVYSLSLQQSGIKVVHGGDGKKKFPFNSLIVIFISFVFLVGSTSMSLFLSKYISFNNQDVRPSLVSTSQVVYKAIRHNPFFGTGPNTFSFDWALWSPKEMISTIFWNVDFPSGVGLVPTFAATTGIVGFLAWVVLFVVVISRGIQSLRIAMKDTVANYFIIANLLALIYSWISIIFYTPNIVMLMIAFLSSGMLIGVLSYKKVIKTKTISFLNDPRNSFFAILGIMVLMFATVSGTYIFSEKFASILYFSKSIKVSGTTLESLVASENMLLNAVSLDHNDVYYRTLSQVYINQMGVISNDKSISTDRLKSTLQQLINSSEASAREAVSINKKNYLNYVNLGNVYASFVPLAVDKSYDSAKLAYDEAIKLAPRNPSLLLLQAQLEFINKNNTKAREYAKKALELKPNYTDAVFFLAQIDTSEGNLPNAIKQAEYASTISPQDATVFFRLGVLRYNNSNYDSAVDAFEQAVILNPSYLNARYFLGKSYQKVGKTSDALVQFNILDKAVPDNQEVKDAIASLSKKDDTTDSKLDTKLPIKEKQ